MKIKQKGSPEDFARAIKNRISMLSGINSSETVMSSCDECFRDVHGLFGEVGEILTIAQMREYWEENKDHDPVLMEYRNYKEWLKDTLDNMESVDNIDIESSEAIMSADDATDDERYLHTLIGDIQSEIEHEVESIQFDQDDSNLYMTVVYMGMVKEYKIPFDDLSFEFDTIESDVEYVANTVRSDLDLIDDSTNDIE